MTDGSARIKAVLKTSVVGIIVNVLLASFKTAIGLLINSIAILSDGINNFADATSSLITIIATFFAGKDPDKKHPFGYGRLEYLSSLAIGGLIFYAGIASFVEAVKAIAAKETSDYSIVTLFIVAVAVVVKLLLGLYTKKKGEQVDSDALVASGKDAMLDSIISLSTIVAAVIYIFTEVSLEAWLAAIISILIMKAGVETLKDTVSKILGEPGDVQQVIEVKKAIASFEGVNGAYDLVINDYGPGKTLASVHIEVDDNMSADDLDRLTRHITDKVRDEHGIYLTAVGVYSKNLTDNEAIELERAIRKVALGCEMVKGLHGFYVNKEEKDIRFDLVISLAGGNRRVYYNKACETIKALYPEYSFVVGMDMDFNEIYS